MKRFIAALVICATYSLAHAEDPVRWIVYYDDEKPAEAFIDYDIIAFDRDYHPSLRELQNQGKTLLGYISFGEAEAYREDFATIQQLGVLLEENPMWPGHYIVDIRDPAWTKYVIEEVMPDVIQSGFDGIIVDTLDSIEALEARHPERYAGMVDGAVKMVKAVRTHYPNITIMINRGFDTLPRIAGDIDYVLAESIMVKHLPDDETYTLFPDAIYQDYVDQLDALQKQAPHLEVVTVDYWDPTDHKGIRHIYDTQRAQGFIPYVTTIGLDRVHQEPAQ